MSMPQPERRSLAELTAASSRSPQRFVADATDQISLSQPAAKEDAEPLRGRTVLISAERQLPVVQALLQLDGIARRILLCPSDLPAHYIPDVIAEAEVDAIVSDGTGPAGQPVSNIPIIPIGQPAQHRHATTEWLLFTSGTTGRPKIVVHTLQSLIGPLDDIPTGVSAAIWSTFYDIRRYGGLQILLRALLGGGSIVLSQAQEPMPEFLTRARQAGVTHISGTPSHWRRALMSPAVKLFTPTYVRLSGEVADQAILDNLADAFPGAAIAHAFASTEAGFAFDVRDGQAGFPASLVGSPDARVAMRVVDGSLRIRSARTASQYLSSARQLADADGFIDTGDMVECRDGRYYFVGRREGIINVGGQKVHPEEVEAVISRHPSVQGARVRGLRSPITGAIVIADIVLKSGSDTFEAVRHDILEACRLALPRHKVPARLTEVAALEISASGKLVRPA
jgi:acyl-CoA synthetase (AMP-forming)/AMP-acid ligase II